MMTIPRVQQAISQDDSFVTVNLQDTTFNYPFGEDIGIYESMIFPCGISLAPPTFTKCMEAILGSLQHQGLRVLNYLDDWLACA